MTVVWRCCAALLASSLILVGISTTSSAHTASANPYFKSEASNGVISYANPSFVVHDGVVDLDVVWSPEGQPWDQHSLAFWMAGYDQDGIRVTYWQYGR